MVTKVWRQDYIKIHCKLPIDKYMHRCVHYALYMYMCQHHVPCGLKNIHTLLMKHTDNF